MKLRLARKNFTLIPENEADVMYLEQLGFADDHTIPVMGMKMKRPHPEWKNSCPMETEIQFTAVEKAVDSGVLMNKLWGLWEEVWKQIPKEKK